jgi:hypothetical protein
MAFLHGFKQAEAVIRFLAVMEEIIKCSQPFTPSLRFSTGLLSRVNARLLTQPPLTEGRSFGNVVTKGGGYLTAFHNNIFRLYGTVKYFAQISLQSW